MLVKGCGKKEEEAKAAAAVRDGSGERDDEKKDVKREDGQRKDW
jgi:hypothetical protein